MATHATTALFRTSRQEDTGLQSQDDFTIRQFCGDWVTTNDSSRGIRRVVITQENDSLRLQAFGALPGNDRDWGMVDAEVFADGASSTRIRAFRAFFDFGFMETHLQAKTEKGVLVIASFNRFKDQSGRENYFSREFFHRVQP